MKKVIISLGVVAMFVAILFMADESHSYSGSRHYLSETGTVKVTKYENVYELQYTDSDSTLTKKEKKCLRKLSKQYAVLITEK